ncbi:MAG: NAD-dependent epimerase/dehydratase family protein [Nanoarchaeota archaeon]|nr:NAD-dependent epimerase/dehydratase family protein [Nanoarchaeota archaeon]
MKCLVTGGAGFIGSHVAEELVKLGHEVVVIDDLSGGFEENLPSGAVFVKGSVCDHKLINDLFGKYKFDYVYHLAAYAAENLSNFIKRFNYHNNLIGSVNLINASVNHNVKCFVFTSSIAVYGHNQTPMAEELTPEPADSYGIAKYAVEQELKRCKEFFDLNYIIFRPHNVYGERQNMGDKYRNVLGIFINQLLKGDSMTVFGDGEQTRAFTYIGDIAPTIAKAPFVEKAYNQVFNIGADKPYSVNQIADYIAEAMGVEKKTVNLDARHEVVNAFSDHSKLNSIFGHGSEADLKEGIRKMVEWSKKQGFKSSKKFEGVEILKNMPPSWLEDYVQS